MSEQLAKHERAAAPQRPAGGSAQRARTRRLALLLALVAAGMYTGFIVLQVLGTRS